jgi:hypothetical protein
VIALLIVVGGVLGIVLYNNHQTAVHNSDATATALAQAQITGTAQAYASATANAQATVTYNKTHYPFSTDLVLNDQLKNNSGVSKWGWDTGTAAGASCTFTNGAYEITESKSNLIQACFGQKTNFSNFTFEVQMNIKTGGTSATGGVVFRANSNTDELYVFFLDTDGNYFLDRRANSSGASTATLSKGQVTGYTTGFYQLHTIGISANGTQITIYVDSNKTAQVNDPTYTSGSIGMISDYGTSATTVAYTNAKVWQI